MGAMQMLTVAALIRSESTQMSMSDLKEKAESSLLMWVNIIPIS